VRRFNYNKTLCTPEGSKNAQFAATPFLLTLDSNDYTAIFNNKTRFKIKDRVVEE
jgi:hypothetical protein